MRLSALTLAALLSATALAAHAQASADPLHVYGPGGPAPAMRDAAKAYEARTGRAVAVVAGPTGKTDARCTRCES